MHRGTAISAPFALAHFLFLPAMDPIEIAHYPVRFLFLTLTYSMIFHRGVPNFSYARESGDTKASAYVGSSKIGDDGFEENNDRSSWVVESPTMTVDAFSDNNFRPSWVGDSSTIDKDAASDHDSSTMTVHAASDDNVNVSWIKDSSTTTIEAAAGNTSTVIIEDFEEYPTFGTDVTPFSTPWNSQSESEDTYNLSFPSVSNINVSVLWIGENSTLDKDLEDWNGTCRDGKMQSPIHIMTVTAEVNPEAQPIIFINYDLASLEAVVTPHTIKFDVKPHSPGYTIGIAGGGLMGFYELNHIHLHWSSSEHSIDQNAYKMEAHLVHFKKPHGNLTEDEVLDEPDGIAVLAVLFELGTADPIIEDLILNLGRNQTQAGMPKVMPKSFLPENTDEFIRYRGSLTTPPCSEVVIWTIFPTPKTLTQYQVKWLSTRKLSEGVPDPDNYRSVQNRNDREIVLMKASYTINVIPGHLESGNATASYGAPSIPLILATILCFSFRSC